MAIEIERPIKKRGRRPWLPTEQNVKDVKNLAARGLTYQQIADALGISMDTLIHRRKEIRVFAEAFQKGRAEGIAVAASVVFDTITKSKQESLKLGAAQFYLARRGDWREQFEAAMDVTVNGQPISLDEAARAREEQMDLIRLMTVEERREYLDLMDRVARRQKGEVIEIEALPAPDDDDDDGPMNGNGSAGNGFDGNGLNGGNGHA